MEPVTKPSRISRVDLRYRHRAQDIPPEEEPAQKQGAVPEEEDEEPPSRDINEPLLIREQKGRSVMGKAHRMFHRRAAQNSPNVLTIAVEVIATLDANGNIVGQETVTPSIPAVPAVPTAPLPSVPSVPEFPSDLTVPAYPWPSGVPTATVVGVAPSSQVVISSPLSTVPSLVESTIFPSTLGFNSTITSTSSSLSSNFSSLNSTSTSSSSRSSSSSSRFSSTSITPTPSSSAASPTSAVGGGGGGPVNTAPAPTATTAATASDDSDGGGSLSTPKVVGSVIGSLAGFALLLALLLFLLKRHKQKQRGGALQLPDDGTDNQPMTSSATRSSFVPASFLNRFSGASKSTAETSTTGERGFQRISGRKLPSAFSEGMTSEQFARGEGTLSGSSFYKDDSGFYGGTGMAGKEFGKETGETSAAGAMGTRERVMPSPARTPVIHHPDDAPPFGTSRNGGSTLSPPHSPDPDYPPRGTLGRSHPSHDGSRSSRFTENV